MTTHIGVGLDDQRQGYECGRKAAHAALAQLGVESVSLALLFTSHPEPHQVLKGVNAILGAVPLVGTTTSGQYTHDGYVEHGTGVLLVHSKQIHFHALAHQRHWFTGRKLFDPLYGLSKEGLGSLFSHRTLMLFPDDQSMNLDSVVEQAMTETALLYDILGGPGLSEGSPARLPILFHNDRAFQRGLSGVEVLSQRPLGMALANGWVPCSQRYRVTRADAHRVITIDGRPAIEIYEDFFSDNRIEYNPETLPKLLPHYPLGWCREGACKVNIPMRFDQDGALQLVSPPPPGSLIQIFSTRPDVMLQAAARAVQQALQGMNGADKAGALLIDCHGNGMLLAEAYQQYQAAMQQALGNLPFLGVRCHGVLARLRDQTAGHYECSVAACILPM
ncbi:MAG: FIST N-terminal domain-containing protein [Aggregatilineales bacterium]